MRCRGRSKANGGVLLVGVIGVNVLDPSATLRFGRDDRGKCDHLASEYPPLPPHLHVSRDDSAAAFVVVADCFVDHFEG